MTTDVAVSLGLSDVQEIGGGRQSLGAYAARLGSQRVVLKLVEARYADREALETRLHALLSLGAVAADEAAICRPVALADRLVNELDLYGVGIVYAVAYEFAEGDAPRITDPQHATLMGRVLGELHSSMASLPRFDLPELAAFPPRSAVTDVANELGVSLSQLPDTTRRDDYSPVQLLHGDFSWKNLRLGGGAVRVFDFDDCGYGPTEFDLALSLYMVLFGAMTGPEPDSYTTFRTNFLAGYRSRSSLEFSESTLDALISYRVLVLASWLAHPTTAPTGIQTSPDHWRATLRRFTQHYVATTF